MKRIERVWSLEYISEEARSRHDTRKLSWLSRSRRRRYSPRTSKTTAEEEEEKERERVLPFHLYDAPSKEPLELPTALYLKFCLFSELQTFSSSTCYLIKLCTSVYSQRATFAQLSLNPTNKPTAEIHGQPLTTTNYYRYRDVCTVVPPCTYVCCTYTHTYIHNVYIKQYATHVPNCPYDAVYVYIARVYILHKNTTPYIQHVPVTYKVYSYKQ